MLAQTAPDWLDVLLGPAGLLVGLLVAIFGLLRRWWVPGWMYADKVKEVDQWREMALRGTTLAEKAVRSDGEDAG